MTVKHFFKTVLFTIIHFIKNFHLKKIIDKTVRFIRKPLLPFKLYKMLFNSFLYWYFIAQSLFIVIFLIFDFFTKIDKYIDNSVNVFQILYISFLLIPKALWLSMPIAIMFGIIMAIASFYQDNELIAVFTSGISIYKFVIPLVIFCFFMSFAMIFIDSFVVIPTYRYRENLFEHLTHSKTEEQDITLRGNNDYFWSFQEMIDKKNMLLNVMVFKIDEKTDRFKVRIDATSAYYINSGWVFTNGILREWDDKGEMKTNERFNKKLIEGLTEKPVIFKNVFNKSDFEIEKMTIPEAKQRIKLLKSLNIDCNQELRDYYKKFSFPFTLLIVCLLAIGVSTLSQKNILILSLFFSIGLAIIYYVTQMVLDILATNGTLYPFLAAWLGILIFIPVALYFVSRAKT